MCIKYIFFLFEWRIPMLCNLYTSWLKMQMLRYIFISQYLCCWDCSSLIPVLWSGTMASSKGNWRKWLVWILLFHFLFYLIFQSILIFSRWLELQLFLLDSQRQTPSCPEDRVLFYSSVDIPDEKGKNIRKFSQEDFLSFHNNKTDIF